MGRAANTGPAEGRDAFGGRDARRRIAAAAESLVDWYLREARDLPWRSTDDPWAILVSEIMLQQTRVETVRERWVEFLERFPTIESLAGADEEEVLALWSGLGYYRRARNLWRLARQVVEEHDGRLPADREALRSLPGIGDYTSAAVASIAFGLPCLSIDGNVARVLSRLLATPEDARRPRARRALERTFAESLARWPPAELNQALMELGARVCLPRSPRCESCPCEDVCRARALGIERELPPSTRKKVHKVIEAAAVIEHRGRLLLVRGQRPAGQLARMWEFPTLDSRRRAKPERDRHVAEGELPLDEDRLAGELVEHLGSRGLTISSPRHIGTVRHGITDRRISCQVYRARLDGDPDAGQDAAAAGDERTWLEPTEAESAPIASATRKILELLQAREPRRE